MPASRSGSHGACHGRALGWQRVHIGRGPQAQNVGCRRGRRVVRSLGCWPWRPNGSWRGRPPGRDVAVGTRSPAQPVGCCAPEARPMIREGTCRGGSDASAPARGPNRVRQGLLDSHPTRRPPRGPLRGRLAGDSLDATTRAARLGQERGQQHRRAVAPLSRGWGVRRCSTASWWRRTRISISLAASERTHSIIQLSSFANIW